MVDFIIWNGRPEIFTIPIPFLDTELTLRWYGLLFALGFLISQQILYYIYRKEGKPEKDVETLTIYMVIATIIGARLGHVIFYQPELFLEDPLSIILPIQFSPEFRITGFQGLASHGGAFGILFALWLYSNYQIELNNVFGKGKVFTKTRKQGQSYLQVLDRIAILVALTGALIRFGNYFNSEIIGKPTDSPFGVVFAGRVTEALEGADSEINPVETVAVIKNEDLPEGANGRVPIYVYIFFKPGTEEGRASGFVSQDAQFYLSLMSEFVDHPPLQELDFQIETEANGAMVAKISTFGIERHPAQLYESISCLLLFIFLFWYWTRFKEKTPPGRIFGLFLVLLWSLRFFYEFLKENQVDFEDSLALNMGQILSIPLFIVGMAVLIYSYKKPNSLNSY